MTPLAELRNGVIEQALTAGLANREQDHHLHNPTPEADSLAEILAEIGRNSTGRTRQLAAEGLRLVKQIRDLNDLEHTCERQIAGDAERITAETLERRRTIKQLAAELRPVLTDLRNPAVRGRRDARLAELAAIVGRTPGQTLRSVSLRHELGVNKFTDLQALLAGAETRRAA